MSQGRRTSPRSRWIAAAAAVLVILVAAVAISIGLLGSQPHSSLSACTVSSGQGTASSGQGTAPFILTPDQTQNASIIAAVGIRKGMPDHAVTVALATALQESHLMNLPYGDRDSLGLFQQRPSQGWGTSTQILDPAYAAGAFYDRLVQVPGWQTLPVTEAAQLVQSSATPTAYAGWEPEARALAIAATGERPATLTCQLNAFGGNKPADTALATAATAEFGPHALANPSSTKAGWQYATWVVAHAYNYHLTSVSYDGLQWTWNSTSTTWSSAPMSSSVITTTQ